MLNEARPKAREIRGADLQGWQEIHNVLSNQAVFFV